MKLIPMGDRLLVRLEKVEERKVGRIIIQDQHSEPTRIGIVEAVGPDVNPKNFKVGDKVVASFHQGVVVELWGEGERGDPLRVFREAEIMLKAED